MATSEAKRGAIGIDHGTRRTGFAAADATRIIVTPLETIAGGDDDVLDEIARMREERDVAHLVVGYPLHMDGRSGARVQEVDAFIKKALDA